MQYDNNKKRATPGAKSFCPCCNGKLIAACGLINVHHWRHESQDDCDTWSEGESEWHVEWKSHAKPEHTEVVVGPHRADIKNDQGLVIELQHSFISPGTMAQREEFYGNMVWLFDCRAVAERITLNQVNRQWANYGAEWLHARNHILTASKPTFLDLGNNKVFAVRRKSIDVLPVAMTGYLLTYDQFVKRYIVRGKHAPFERIEARRERLAELARVKAKIAPAWGPAPRTEADYLRASEQRTKNVLGNLTPEAIEYNNWLASFDKYTKPEHRNRTKKEVTI